MRKQPKGGRATGAAAALLAVMLLVTACSASGKADEGDNDGGAGDDGKPAVQIVISPEDGAESVATSDELRVTAEGGTLTEVAVSDADGTEIPGELAEDGASWEPSEHLANATDYTVNAVGKSPEGEEVTETAQFTTVAADATFTSSWNIPDDSSVGVGMILSVTFDTPIEDTEAVRDAIRVSTDPEVEVRGHWFGNQRLDFRPADYWVPDTEVTVNFRIRGVEGAPGVYGTLHGDSSFTIGRSQVSTVDAKAKTMVVKRDGAKLDTIPITTGAPGTDTWNGKMVISERFKETRMDGSTVGFGGEYDIEDVPHAMRLSQSGTFIHGNYWAGAGTFGSANVSHGCIGIQDKQGGKDSAMPAAWFYENSIIGDVVEVINSNDDIIAPDNGLNGWNMSWDAWGSGQ